MRKKELAKKEGAYSHEGYESARMEYMHLYESVDIDVLRINGRGV